MSPQEARAADWLKLNDAARGGTFHEFGFEHRPVRLTARAAA